MAININAATVEVSFAGVLDTNPSTTLKGTDLQVLVNGGPWTAYTATANTLTVLFDSDFLLNQQTFEIKTSKGTTNLKYAIKTQVYAEDDVVLVEYGPTDVVPKLPTYTQVINNLVTTQPNICFDPATNLPVPCNQNVNFL